MLPAVIANRNTWRHSFGRLCLPWQTRPPAPPGLTVPLQRPNLAHLAQPDAQLPAFVTACPVAQRYRDLLGPLD